jgi:hypothetical protein
MAQVEKGALNINLQGEEANQMILKPVFFDDGIEELFDTMNFVNKDQKIAYVGTLENILKSVDGCGFNPDGSFSISQRTMSTRQVGIALELCYDEFKDTIYKQLAKKGTAISDLSGTVFGNLLALRAQQGVKKDIIKTAFFGNKASTDDKINYADGMWSVYIPALVADGLIPYINSGSGTPLTAGEGIELLRTVKNRSSNFLKATPNTEKVMYVSANVYEQYITDLQANGQSSDLHFVALQSGIRVLMFDGVEVKPMWEWQAYALEYLGLANANLVLYTIKKNFVLGTDIENYANQMKMWYDEIEEKIFIKSKFYLGFNFKHEEFITVAY